MQARPLLVMLGSSELDPVMRLLQVRVSAILIPPSASKLRDTRLPTAIVWPLRPVLTGRFGAYEHIRDGTDWTTVVLNRSMHCWVLEHLWSIGLD